MRPAAYVLQRDGQVKDVGVADGEARPQGSDQLAFGSPPQVGDALYLGFEEPLDRLILQIDVDASQARGAGVNPEDPPLRWEVSQADGEWAAGDRARGPHRRLQLRLRHGRARAAAALASSPPLGGHRLHWLRCRIDRDDRAAARTGATYTHPPEIYSITAAPIGALLPVHARRARSSARSSASSDGTPGQVFPLRHQPGAQARHRRDARGPGPGVRRLGALGAARPTSSARPSSTATSCSTSSPARSSSARRSARPTAAGPSTARSRPRARCCASRATATAAGATATSRPDTLTVLKSTIAGVDTVTNPDAGDRRRRRRDHRPTRASARRWRSARATARSPPRTSSSWPARRARASRAPSASRRATAAPCRCTSSRASTRPTASCDFDELMPEEDAAHRGRRVPRRAAPDRHDGRAPAVPLPRPVASS